MVLEKQFSICGFDVYSDEKRSKKQNILFVCLVAHSICAPFVLGKILVLLVVFSHKTLSKKVLTY